MTTSHEQPELMTRVELAALLRLHVRELDRMRSAGKIPAPVRVGPRAGKPLWPRWQIVAWIDAGCPTALQFQAMQIQVQVQVQSPEAGRRHVG